MKIQLPVGGTKRYRDEQTGLEYRFDYIQFYYAFHDAAKREGGTKKVEDRLAGTICMSRMPEPSHFPFSDPPDYPADISAIRGCGAALAGDEDAFLRPLTLPERPSQTSPEELKRRGEREWADLEKRIHLCSGEEGELRAVRETFMSLWEILSLYDISDGYNRRTDTGGLEGAEEYFDGLLESLREKLRGIDASSRVNEDNIDDIITNSCIEGTLRRCSKFLRDVTFIVQSYSLPGVNEWWRGANSRLNYYDPVFVLLEKATDEEERTRILSGYGYYHPSRWDIQMRQLYFSGLEGPWENAARARLQEELLDTLIKVFEERFVC